MKRILFLVCLAFAVLMLQANELVYQDKQGVIRWTKNGGRVALYGANYCLPSACDYRAASYVNADRDAMIVEDLDQVLTTCFSLDAFIASIFFIRLFSTNGPFLTDLLISLSPN